MSRSFLNSGTLIVITWCVAAGVVEGEASTHDGNTKEENDGYVVFK